MSIAKKKWFREAACFLVKERKMKRKTVAEMFGVDPHAVGRAIKRYEETGQHGNYKGQGWLFFFV